MHRPCRQIRWPACGVLALLCAGVAGGCVGPLLGFPSDPTYETIVYREIDGTTLTLDVYRPVLDGPAPCVIMLHGGGWVMQAPDYANLDAWGRHFAERGYVALNVRYRLAPMYRFPEPMLDVVAAVRYARAHSAELGIDPAHIALLGNSAGGQLALLAGLVDDVEQFGDAGDATVDRSVSTVIAMGSPTDLRTVYLDGFSQLAILCVQIFLGTTPDDGPDRYNLASPIAHAHSTRSPYVLLVHALLDETVPYTQAVQMYDALRDAGKPVVLLPIVDIDHSAYLIRSDIRLFPAFDQIDELLDTTLR